MVFGQVLRWTDRNSAQDFDRRYSDDGVQFWAPKLIEFGAIASGQLVLDAGCGTGGFGAAIGAATDAQVIGCDIAERFTRYARDKHSPVGRWIVGDAARLPLHDNTADCVLMSLLLHRVPDPAVVVADAVRVMRPTGVLLIHTIAPEVAAASAPYRYFPTMATAQHRRLPTAGQLRDWSQQAGLTDTSVRRITRPMKIDADSLEKRVREETPHRYPEIGAEELSAGLQQLSADQQQHGGPWHEPRAHTVVIAKRTPNRSH
jgi:ubiquinone/menaquinone biosynthesis C-methylase UbiE